MSPPLADPARWALAHGAPVAQWLPLLEHFAAAWGWRAAPWSRLPGGEDCAAFAHGADRVLKVLRPDADPACELDLLAAVRLPVPTPRLLHQGRHAGWTALALTRLPGVTLEQAWPELREDERLGVLRALGGLLPHLAAVRPPPSVPRPDLRARAEARFGPEATALLAQAGPLGDPVLLHGDLTDDNTFGARGAQGWALSGVLDFGGSYVGPALVELVAPALFLVRDRPPRLAALLAGAGLRPTAPQLAAANLVHPYVQLERDIGLLGGRGASVGALVAAWARLVDGAGA